MNSNNNNNIPTKPITKTVDNTIEKGYYIHSKKLGEGGFGVVKLATHLSTNQKVAIKIINKKKIGKDLFRVSTEIAALKVLRHPNIAKLLQVIENDEYIYLVMEYCCGGELFDYIITRSRLNDQEARHIIRSLVRVLGYIHGKGFAHRDIKPENILLDSSHNVKLIDFGLAASSQHMPTGGLDGLSTCCGSPAYVAPELLRGLKYSGPAADVWSTGVLLYTLLVGELPFCDQNLSVLYKKIKMGVYKTPTFMKADAKELISRMLCTDPVTRITVPEILEHCWINGSAITGKIERIDSAIIMLQDDESAIDDQILMKCAALFHDYGTDLNQLRKNIQTRFGYQTAAYWLIRENPSLFKDLCYFAQPAASARRRSRSFSDFQDGHKMAKIVVDSEPVVVGSRTKPGATAAATTAGSALRPPATPTIDGRLKTLRMPKTDIKTISGQKRTNGFHGGTVLPAQVQAKVQTRPLHQPPTTSKKLFSLDQTAASTPAKVENFANRKIATNFKNQKLNFNQENKENFSADPSARSAFKAKNSPLAHKSLDHAKRCLIGPDASGDVTPKKSLIKRLLESATPRKLSSPRRFSINDKNIAYKAMTITNYNDVQACTDHIVRLLTACHVNCKVKHFTIRCVLSSMNVIIVAFELELMICRNTGKIAIQRKRLRGTAWDYLKICEELNKVQMPPTSSQPLAITTI